MVDNVHTYKFQEWYLLIEGNTPVRVFNDKPTALAALQKDYRLTTKEAKDIADYAKSLIPAMGQRLVVTGLTGKPDRALLRIFGPSANMTEQLKMPEDK